MVFIYSLFCTDTSKMVEALDWTDIPEDDNDEIWTK